MLLLIALLGRWWPQNSSNQKAPSPSEKTARHEKIQALMRQARSAAQAHDDDAHLQAIEQLIELQPQASDWRMMYCQLLSRRGRYRELAEACRSAIEQGFSDEISAEFRVKMADALIKLGDGAAARQALEPLLSNASIPHPWVVPLWAKVLRLEGKSDEALEYLQRSLPADHGNASAYQLLGMLEFDVGRYDAAFEHLKMATQLDPYSDVTQFKLSECARLMGDVAAAQSYREHYARLHADNLRIDALLHRWYREKSLSRAEATELAELYRKTGQSEQADHWSHYAARP